VEEEYDMQTLQMFQSIIKHTHADGGSDNSEEGYTENIKQLPNYNLESKILNYKQFCSLWY
jgi:hypothetical protein